MKGSSQSRRCRLSAPPPRSHNYWIQTSIISTLFLLAIVGRRCVASSRALGAFQHYVPLQTGKVVPRRRSNSNQRLLHSLSPRLAEKRTMSSSSGATTDVVHAPEALIPPCMKRERTRVLTLVRSDDDDNAAADGSLSFVAYWMQRDVRTVDNWALAWAAHLAERRNVPLRVVYALPPPPRQNDDETAALPPALQDMPMTARHGTFLLGGLQHVHQELQQKNIPLHVIMADSHNAVGETACREVLLKSAQSTAAMVVADFSPLRQHREWLEVQMAPLLEKAGVPLYQVDAHNVVPVWAASNKREVGARTLRPRIHRVLSNYLQQEAFPPLTAPANNDKDMVLPDFELETYQSFLDMDDSVPPVAWARPGTTEGLQKFHFFLNNGLSKFHELRNDPVQKDICSGLSAWINHGHVSFQSLLMQVKKLNKYANGTASYIEEGVIRRELSDNYVFYTPDGYDSLDGAYAWARETLQVHAQDPREYVYTLEELELAQTHDDLWNAAQLQLVREGRMHGFLRMYWAKKILEWTDPELDDPPTFALRAAQYLNDKYALDGKDPNGFVGVGWSIMGIHDQGWKERPIFGKIRYMNYNGCKRKFKIPPFVARYKGATENAAKASKKSVSGQKRQATLEESFKPKGKQRKS